MSDLDPDALNAALDAYDNPPVRVGDTGRVREAIRAYLTAAAETPRARLEQELALVCYQRQELLMAMKRIEHCSMFVPAGTTPASALAAIQSHATQTIALAMEKVAALDAADD